MSTVKANTIEPASGGTVTIIGADLTTPALGTPASGTLTNCTGLPANTGLSGTTLASNVVNASINAVTPTGGAFAITGGLTTTGDVGVGVSPTAGPAGTRKVQIGGSSDGTSGLLVKSSNSSMTLYASSTAASYLVALTSTPVIFGSGPDDLSSFTEYFRSDAANLRPGSDNATNLGHASYRWAVVYAGTGTINTSDEREKTNPVALSDTEKACALELASMGPRKFQWLDAVAKKGADQARWHIGFTVQQVMQVMKKHGLDPSRYGMICYDRWPEKRDADGNVTQAAGDRWGFRSDQLDRWITSTALKALIERVGL